jgi:hypothetical protein
MKRLIRILCFLIFLPNAFAQDLNAQFVEVDLGREYVFLASRQPYCVQ